MNPIEMKAAMAKSPIGLGTAAFTTNSGLYPWRNAASPSLLVVLSHRSMRVCWTESSISQAFYGGKHAERKPLVNK
jgi:hypothetical protein